MRTTPVVFTALCILIRISTAAGCDVPLEPTRTSFTAAVRIGNSGPFRFLFDTATTQTVVSPTVARLTGIGITGTVRVISSSGPVDAQRGLATDVSIGPVMLHSLAVVVMPLPRFPLHGRVDGILGMDVLAGRSFLLDVQRHCLQLDRTPAALSGGSRVPAMPIAGRVALLSDGLRFVLDSAASFVVLTSDRAQRLATRDGVIELTTAGGRRTAFSGVISRLEFGSVKLRNLEATVIPGVDPREDALLPTVPFETIFVAADRSFVVLNAKP